MKKTEVKCRTCKEVVELKDAVRKEGDTHECLLCLEEEEDYYDDEEMDNVPLRFRKER